MYFLFFRGKTGENGFLFSDINYESNLSCRSIDNNIVYKNWFRISRNNKLENNYFLRNKVYFFLDLFKLDENENEN